GPQDPRRAQPRAVARRSGRRERRVGGLAPRRPWPVRAARDVLAVSDDFPNLEPGRMVGEFRIEHALARGNFGDVYQAVHSALGKRVAIKVLASNEPEMCSRLAEEAKAAVAAERMAWGFGTLPDGRAYYIVDYVDGDKPAPPLEAPRTFPDLEPGFMLRNY